MPYFSSRAWSQAKTRTMLAAQATRVVTVGEWEERWDNGEISFHQPQVHK